VRLAMSGAVPPLVGGDVLVVDPGPAGLITVDGGRLRLPGTDCSAVYHWFAHLGVAVGVGGGRRSMRSAVADHGVHVDQMSLRALLRHDPGDGGVVRLDSRFERWVAPPA